MSEAEQKIAEAKKNNSTDLELCNSDLQEMPEEILSMKNLTFLGFSHNKLQHLPKNIFEMSSLKNLDLFNNKITELPIEIGLLEELEYLELSKNPLPDKKAKFYNGKKEVQEFLKPFRNVCDSIINPVVNACLEPNAKNINTDQWIKGLQQMPRPIAEIISKKLDISTKQAEALVWMRFYGKNIRNLSKIPMAIFPEESMLLELSEVAKSMPENVIVNGQAESDLLMQLSEAISRRKFVDKFKSTEQIGRY